MRSTGVKKDRLRSLLFTIHSMRLFFFSVGFHSLFPKCDEAFFCFLARDFSTVRLCFFFAHESACICFRNSATGDKYWHAYVQARGRGVGVVRELFVVICYK